jgi:hypothetical protein
MSAVRTTLTVDDDLFEELQKRARESDQSFKAVINDVIRRGLRASDPIAPSADPFVVEARSCGFRPGVDPAKLNQLLDDLEIDDLTAGGSEGSRVADS